jgi:hypothetical protein
MTRFRPLILAVLLSCAWPVLAVSPAVQDTDDAPAMPAWEQLSPAQRELLLAPVRERWNGNPGERTRMYEHAQRWHDMTPEQRKRAHRGMRRFSHMKPEQREEARALFESMRALPPQQRAALRAQWKAMTPEQRRAWVQAHPPADPPPR